MNTLLYLLLLVLPFPLIIFLIKQKHYLYCLPPFVAFIGIYVYNIIGSVIVIKDGLLFSWMYYFSLVLIIVLFYLFYFAIFSIRSELNIDWTVIHRDKIDGFTPLLTILWLYSFYMFYLYYQRHGLPTLFRVNLFQYTDIYALRAEGSTSLPENGHWYWFAFSTIPSFILVYTYILKRLYPTTATKTYFYLNLPLILFFNSLYLQKSPYVYLLTYILLANFFINGKPIAVRKLIGYIALGAGAVIIMLRIYLLDRSFITMLKIVPSFLYTRICVAYTKAHAYTIQIFPDQHDFFYGTAFSNPGHVFPFEPVDLSQFLGYWINGILQNFSAPSFSQGYANFGFTGFIMIIMFMFLQILLFQIVFKRCPKNPLFLTLYVLCIINMLGYGNTSILQIFNPIFVLFSIACVFANYFSKHIISQLIKSIKMNNLQNRNNNKIQNSKSQM